MSYSCICFYVYCFPFILLSFLQLLIHKYIFPIGNFGNDGNCRSKNLTDWSPSVDHRQTVRALMRTHSPSIVTIKNYISFDRDTELTANGTELVRNQ